MELLIPLSKVDEEKRLIIGRAVQEIPDRSGEIIDYASAKPAFEEWSNSFSEATGGLSKGNLRVMHGQQVAGKVIDISFNDDEKAIDVVAKVVDDNEWKKVLEGCYTGFSVGGKYARKWNDGSGNKRYTPKVAELSLVDRPCIPSAKFFELQKADGTLAKVEFKASEDTETQKFQFNEELISVLKKRVADHNEADGSEHLAKLHTLKTVFQRGVSAFNRSPVEGKTKEDFGMGRVEMYLGALSKADGVETHDPDLLPVGHPLRKSRAKTFGDLFKADGRKGRDGDGDGKLNEDGEGSGQGPRRNRESLSDRSNVAVIPERRWEGAGIIGDYGVGALLGGAGGAAWAAGGGAYDKWREVGDKIYRFVGKHVGRTVGYGATGAANVASRLVSGGARAAEKKLGSIAAKKPVFPTKTKTAGLELARIGSKTARLVRRGATAATAKTGQAQRRAVAGAAEKVSVKGIQAARTGLKYVWNAAGDTYRTALRMNRSRGARVAGIGLATAGLGYTLGTVTGNAGYLAGGGALIDRFVARRVDRTNEVGKADMPNELSKAMTFADLYKFDEAKVRRDDRGRFTFKDAAGVAATVGAAALAGRAAYAFARNPERYTTVIRRGRKASGINTANIASDVKAFVDRNGLRAIRRGTVAVGNEVAAAGRFLGERAKIVGSALKESAGRAIDAEVKEFKRIPLSGKAGKIAGAIGTAAAAYGLYTAIKDNWGQKLRVKPRVGPDGVGAEVHVGGKKIGEYSIDASGSQGFKYFGGDDGDGRAGRDADSDGKRNEAAERKYSVGVAARTPAANSGSKIADWRKEKAETMTARAAKAMRITADDSLSGRQQFNLLNETLNPNGRKLFDGDWHDAARNPGKFADGLGRHVEKYKNRGGFVSEAHRSAIIAMIERSPLPNDSANVLISGAKAFAINRPQKVEPKTVIAPDDLRNRLAARVAQESAKPSRPTQFDNEWSYVNWKNEQKGDSRRLTESDWKSLKEKNPETAKRLVSTMNEDAEKWADQATGIKAMKSDGPKTFGDLFKVDGRAGRDGDGDGIKDEKSKSKGGTAKAGRPFDWGPDISAKNLLGSIPGYAAQGLTDAAMRRFIPGGSATVRTVASYAGGIGGGIIGGAVGAKIGEKIDAKTGMKSPVKDPKWGEIIGSTVGGLVGTTAGGAAGVGVASVPGAIAGGLAGQEIGAVAGRFIDRYGAKFANAVHRRFFAPATPRGRQVNV